MSSPFERPKPAASPDSPFVLLVGTAKGDVIHDVNGVAARFGLAPGQRATDAMAAHRDLAVAYADPAYETKALERLAGWARRWSPATRVDGTNGIAVDVSGATHLWGGAEGLARDVGERLGALGLTAQLAVAPNHAAAHALARYRPGTVLEDDPLAALSDLPVAALRIDGASATLLKRLGLKTIADLGRVPRATLKKRFGAGLRRRDPRDDTWEDYLGRSMGASSDVLARLDEALGRVRVPFDPARPVPPARVMQGLQEPVSEVATVLGCLRPLVERLCAALEERDEGVAVLGVEAFRVDGGRASTTLRLSRPTRRVDDLMRLLIDRLDGWRAEFGFDALAVEALESAPLVPEQDDGLEQHRPPDPAALVDRLRTRLGEEAVRRPVLRESHLPERAEAWVPVDEAVPAAPPLTLRPDRMLDFPEEVGVLHGLPDGPPARFTWRRGSYRVERVAGPERIAPEWWRERSSTRARDYWRVETARGERFWLFREGFSGDERGAVTRWFVHGIFS